MVSMTFDSFGFMTVSCKHANTVALYDYSGNFLNVSLKTTLYAAYVTGIDSKWKICFNE